MTPDINRRQALRNLGAFGVGTVVGGGGMAYYAQQYFAESNEPDDRFGGSPPELKRQFRGSGGPLVEVYTDYACPHCHEWVTTVLPELQQMVDNGEMRYTHRDYPLPVDEAWSWRIPNLPRSAQAQTRDVDTFFAVNSYIWSNWPDGNYNEEFVRSVANEFDLDEDKTWEHTRYEWFRPQIELEVELAEDDGVDRTPSVIVDGTLLEENGADRIRQAVESASN